MISDEVAKKSHERLRDIIPTMEGWLTPDRAVEMYDLVRSLQPQTVVEIGVFGGRSLVAQGMALRDSGSGHLYGIDPWKKAAALDELHEEDAAAWWRELDLHKIHSGCMNMIWALELDNYVSVIRAESQNCHQLIPSIDIIYIDGSHTETASCRDVNLYLPKVKQNGYVWADDMDWKSTQKAKQLLLDKCKVVRDCGSYMLFCKY